jgi:outer membrane protein OmpA-like peptidoglycan-associated protein
LLSKNLFLRLESYTENSGDAESDLSLAKARAEAVKGTLTRMGVNPQRIETIGIKHPGPKAESEGIFNGRVKAILYKK